MNAGCGSIRNPTAHRNPLICEVAQVAEVAPPNRPPPNRSALHARTDRTHVPQHEGHRMDPHAVPAGYLYTIPEAVRLLRLSRSVVYEQIRAGRLRTVKQGNSRRVPAVAIQQYVELLVSESEGEAA